MTHRGEDETKDWEGFSNFIEQYILSLEIKNEKKAPFKHISVSRDMYDEAAIGLKRGGQGTSISSCELLHQEFPLSLHLSS